MWVFFAILNPILDASRNVFSKKASANIDSLMVSWINNLIPVLIFTPILFFIEIEMNQEFVLSLFISGTVNTVATILYHKAISKGEISQIVPMLSFTPLFLLISSPLLVGENLSEKGIIGIILIVVGSYLINLNLKHEGLLSPIKSLYKSKGTRYMLFVAFILSISANFDKKGIESSSVLQYLVFINIFIFIGTTTFTLQRKKLSMHDFKIEKRNLLLVGIITSFGYLVHMTAISMTLVAYVIAIKRTAGMISVLLGYLFLNEQNIRERLLGSVIMFIGVLFIVLF